MQLGEHPDRCVLQLALVFDGCVGEPVAAEGVGHDVGRHHRRRRNPSRRTVYPALRRCSPASAPGGQERRSARRLCGSPRIGGPVGTSGTPGRPRRWAPPGPPTSALPACRPRSQRAVRMMVSDDMPVGVHAALHGDLGRDAAGQHRRQPLRQHRGQRRDVAAGTLQSVDFFDAGSFGTGASFCGVITIRWVAL